MSEVTITVRCEVVLAPETLAALDEAIGAVWAMLQEMAEAKRAAEAPVAAVTQTESPRPMVTPVAAAVVDAPAKHAGGPPPSARELRVAELFRQGQSRREIGAALGTSEAMVGFMLHQMRKRGFDLPDRRAASRAGTSRATHDEATKEEVRRLHAEGMTPQAIAGRMGIAKSTVFYMVRGRRSEPGRDAAAPAQVPVPAPVRAAGAAAEVGADFDQIDRWGAERGLRFEGDERSLRRINEKRAAAALAPFRWDVPPRRARAPA